MTRNRWDKEPAILGLLFGMVHGRSGVGDLQTPLPTEEQSNTDRVAMCRRWRMFEGLAVLGGWVVQDAEEVSRTILQPVQRGQCSDR